MIRVRMDIRATTIANRPPQQILWPPLTVARGSTVVSHANAARTIMGYRVERLTAPAACLRPSKVWVSVRHVQALVAGARACQVAARQRGPRQGGSREAGQGADRRREAGRGARTV